MPCVGQHGCFFRPGLNLSRHPWSEPGTHPHQCFWIAITQGKKKGPSTVFYLLRINLVNQSFLFFFVNLTCQFHRTVWNWANWKTEGRKTGIGCFKRRSRSLWFNQRGYVEKNYIRQVIQCRAIHSIRHGPAFIMIVGNSFLWGKAKYNQFEFEIVIRNFMENTWFVISYVIRKKQLIKMKFLNQ